MLLLSSHTHFPTQEGFWDLKRWIQTVVLCGSMKYMACVRLCMSVCILVCGSMTGRGSESRCNNMGGSREHEGGQIQQPQVTWDHRLAGIPRLSVPNHPWIVIGTSRPVLQYWTILPILIMMHPNPNPLQKSPFCSPSTHDGSQRSRFSDVAAPSTRLL